MATTQDFTVAWDDPADAELTWVQDRMHAPEPATPLGELFGELVTHGFCFANDYYSVPMRFRMHTINNWLYVTNNPTTTDAAELAQMGAEAERRYGAAFAELGDLWEKTWLPEIQALLAELEAL